MKKQFYACTVAKSVDDINEDSFFHNDTLMAVSDGAGGSGIYAERWSGFLVNNLPHVPFTDKVDFLKWWEQKEIEYFTITEKVAEMSGDAEVLDKFYDEGSFAALAAVWLDEGAAQWLVYGDSMVFCYDYATKKLTHSQYSLTDFAQSPALLCSNVTEPVLDCLKQGTMACSPGSVIFLASDALSHFLLQTYMVEHQETGSNRQSLLMACEAPTEDATLTCMAMSAQLPFEKVLQMLMEAAGDRRRFRDLIMYFRKRHLIACDDCTFVACTFAD